MPELPEVEIVKRSLKNKIYGKKIKKVIVSNRNLRFKIQNNFEKTLTYSSIIKISRFSKYIILTFDNYKFCIIHLGMSGTIHIVRSRKESLFTNTSFYHSPKLPEKHNHIEFFFSDFKLIYNDPRRFGYFSYFKNDEEINNTFRKYGPEPFDPFFDKNYIFNYFKNKKKILKIF